jgi:hypothetical protein
MATDDEYGLRTALLIKLAENVETLQRLVTEQGATDTDIQRIITDMKTEIERLQKGKMDRPKLLVWLREQWLSALGVIAVGGFVAWLSGFIEFLRGVL